MSLKQTPSQTVGPFFAYGLTARAIRLPATERDRCDRLVQRGTEGERIRIEGRVLDGNGEPIADAMIEVWQADAHGRYDHPADRAATPARSRLSRLRHASAPAPSRNAASCSTPSSRGRSIGDGQAPHLNVIVLHARPALHAYTRLYFSDETEANAADPVLAARAAGASSHADRQSATRRRAASSTASTSTCRATNETVFFDV